MLVCATAPIDRYIVIDFSSHPQCLLPFFPPKKEKEKKQYYLYILSKVQNGYHIGIGENK